MFGWLALWALYFPSGAFNKNHYVLDIADLAGGPHAGVSVEHYLKSRRALDLLWGFPGME